MGKELGLSGVGMPWKRVLRHVASVKVEEEEEEEAAVLLEVDILIGDWMCRRDRREEVAVLWERCIEEARWKILQLLGCESLQRRSRFARGIWGLRRQD